MTAITLRTNTRNRGSWKIEMSFVYEISQQRGKLHDSSPIVYERRNLILRKLRTRSVSIDTRSIARRIIYVSLSDESSFIIAIGSLGIECKVLVTPYFAFQSIRELRNSSIEVSVGD